VRSFIRMRREVLAALCLSVLGFLSIGFITQAKSARAHGLRASANPAQTARQASVPEMLISEFRLGVSSSQPNSSSNEYVELYNNSDEPLTVRATDDSAGWALVSSDGAARFVIPNGTVIPPRGHYLGVNSVGYDLDSYPAGSGSTAHGDATFTADMPGLIGGGIALFRTADPASFTLGNRIDAVGFVNAPALYKESGINSLPVCSCGTYYQHVRKTLPNGALQDTDNNAADFTALSTYLDTVYGTPGPENLSSPLPRSTQIPATLLDASAPASGAPNQVRSGSGDSGTLSLRRTFTNSTGAAITRLRFRVIDLSTGGSRTANEADLRLISSPDTNVTLGNGSVVNVKGTTFEVAPAGNADGGGVNSTASVESVTPSHPLAPGASISVQFLFNVRVEGQYRYAFEAQATNSTGLRKAPSDFDGDGKTDFAVFRRADGAWYALKSGDGGFLSQQFGVQGDYMVAQDYDGDGKTDIAVWRPTFSPTDSAVFYVLRSSDNTFVGQAWGNFRDVPVPDDYDGDGRADFAVFRRGTTLNPSAYWYILRSTDGSLLATQWGVSGDIPQPGDYDGDGKADLTVKRFASGGTATNPQPATFYTLRSSDNGLDARAWGIDHEIEAEGDYDGDGKTDTAVYRWGTDPAGSPGTFYIFKSSGGIIIQQWGLFGDFCVPGDYDGDGRTDFAVWRPSEGTFYVLKSSGGVISQQWGQNGDLPTTIYLGR
jgi:hypothetical protein